MKTVALQVDLEHQKKVDAFLAALRAWKAKSASGEMKMTFGPKGSKDGVH